MFIKGHCVQIMRVKGLCLLGCNGWTRINSYILIRKTGAIDLDDVFVREMCQILRGSHAITSATKQNDTYYLNSISFHLPLFSRIYLEMTNFNSAIHLLNCGALFYCTDIYVERIVS